MQKPSKVVCITDRRRKLDNELEPSIPVRGEANGTLHCERGTNRIDFFLTPLFRNAQGDRNNTRKPKLTVLPSWSNDSEE